MAARGGRGEERAAPADGDRVRARGAVRLTATPHRHTGTLLLIALNLVGGLGLEAAGARLGWEWAEPLVDAVTLVHLGLRVLAPPNFGGVPVERGTLVICLAIATAGELFLSVAWGLYAYRSSLLPAFVPPGHVLLFLTGVAVTRQRWCRDWIVWAVALAALPVLGVLVLRGHDRLSVPLFALFVAFLVFGAERRLYAVMFVLALGLELLGTALGTWRWHAHVPVLGFTDGANPPLAAGAFYACLDLLTGWVRRVVARRPAVAEEAAQSTMGGEPQAREKRGALAG